MNDIIVDYLLSESASVAYLTLRVLFKTVESCEFMAYQLRFGVLHFLFDYILQALHGLCSRIGMFLMEANLLRTSRILG